MDLYSIKRTLLTPYILAMRWRERNSPLLLRQMLETLNYSPAFYRFLRDQIALTEAPIDEESVVLDVGAYDGPAIDPEQAELRDELRRRVQLYRAGQPYRQYSPARPK